MENTNTLSTLATLTDSEVRALLIKIASTEAGGIVVEKALGLDIAPEPVFQNSFKITKEEFKDWAKHRFVLLELDFPRKTKLSDELKKQNEGLAKKFAIQGYPTILFLDASGKQVGKSGYVKGGPQAWMDAAEKELGSKLKKVKKQKAAK